MVPPDGRRRSWAHYGVMMPGLPDPHRFFTVMSIVGTPGVALFANDQLITTTPRDTAYVAAATGAMSAGQFRAYRVREDCELSSDGRMVRFGSELRIAGSHPDYSVSLHHPEVEVELRLEASESVTHFVRLPGTYRHWSVLCHAAGTVGDVGVRGLCTLEYATGVGLYSLFDRRLPFALPARLFTYHVLNVDERTQVLFTHVLGPAGLPLQRAVHVRTPERVTRHRRGHHFVVHEYEEHAHRTPTGRTMRMPRRFTWGARDVIEIHGTCTGDWVYGLGAGYVGSYVYQGSFLGRAIVGTAYLEYIDVHGEPGSR